MPINMEHAAKLAAHLRERGTKLKGKKRYGGAWGDRPLMRSFFSRHACGTVGCIAGENQIMCMRKRPSTGYRFTPQLLAEDLGLVWDDGFDADDRRTHAFNKLIYQENWPATWKLRYGRCAQVSIGAELMCMASYLEYWAAKRLKQEVRQRQSSEQQSKSH